MSDRTAPKSVLKATDKQNVVSVIRTHLWWRRQTPDCRWYEV